MNDRNLLAVMLSVCVMTCLFGCGQVPSEHYVSPQIHGVSQKINLEQVQKAFWETKGQADFKSWMAAFEKRVNEIYDGSDVVSIDASRENNRLVVTGYIEKNNKPGYQDADEKLFSIEQTGDVVNNELPYRVQTGDGRPYYEGHRSILDNPFVQMMILSQLMNSWGGHYSTPNGSYGTLRTYRDTWRQSPQYEQQRASNTDFFSRFKTKSDGKTLQSKTGFGAGTFSADKATPSRTWGSQSTQQSSGFSWGGRRSSTSSFGSSGMRRWGGRRR